MPKMAHVVMLAGSGVIAGATLTYCMMRSREMGAQLAGVPARVGSWLRSSGDIYSAPQRGSGQALPARAAFASSGNLAFDAYREAELERLETEARAFSQFLDQLRQARDRAEFEKFLAERRKD